MSNPFECDLSTVPPEHLRTVCRWVEDRFVNAITPLDARLQRELPGNMKCDGTLQEAARAVRHVLEHVEEIRVLAGAQRGRGAEALTAREGPC